MSQFSSLIIPLHAQTVAKEHGANDNSNLASSTPSEIKESKVVKNETNIEKDNNEPISKR